MSVLYAAIKRPVSSYRASSLPSFTIHYSLHLISLHFSVSPNSESHHYFKSLSSQARFSLRPIETLPPCSWWKTALGLNDCLLRWWWNWFIFYIDQVFICWHTWQFSSSFSPLHLVVDFTWRLTESHKKTVLTPAMTFFVPVIFFYIFPILDLFYVSWQSNPLVSAPLSPSSSYFNFSICRYTGCEPAPRHLPYFITLPSLPSPLQLAINEKNWKCGRRRGRREVQEEVKERRGGSKSIEWVNCERDSEGRDGAGEMGSEWGWVWTEGAVHRQTEKGEKRGRAKP